MLLLPLMLLLTTLAVAYRTPITFSRLAPPTTRLFSTQTTTKSAHLLPLPPTTTPLYLTTPIYYVNAPPHIGHAYTSLATDLISRYYTLSGGAPPYFLTGTDEHGEKVAANAESKGVPVQEFVDGVSEDFRRLLDVYNIRPDQFIRTTGEDHKRAAERFWEALDRNGDVYKGSYSGYYSVRDECYYTDSELVDAPNPDGSGGTIKVAPTGSPVVFKEKEETYFFKLSAYTDKLLEFYDSNPDFIHPPSRRNEVVNFVKGGLRDLSISRTSFQWGIPVPNDPAHVMYVWVDALCNYVSALGYGEQEKSMMDSHWPGVHVVGKDILRFHAVYWPALCMSARIAPPKMVFAHGWWMREGEKMSKSLGNVVDPFQLVEKYGRDYTRYFLMSEVTFGADGDFSAANMVVKCNAALANSFGNLVQRTLSMVHKNCDKAVPACQALTPEDVLILSKARSIKATMDDKIARMELHLYSRCLVDLVRDANVYVDEQAPWGLKKTDPERMGTVLYVLCEVIRCITLGFQPLMPDGTSKILDQLGVPEEERGLDCISDEKCAIASGRAINKPEGVFPRFEEVEEETDK